MFPACDAALARSSAATAPERQLHRKLQGPDPGRFGQGQLVYQLELSGGVQAGRQDLGSHPGSAGGLLCDSGQDSSPLGFQLHLPQEHGLYHGHCPSQVGELEQRQRRKAQLMRRGHRRATGEGLWMALHPPPPLHR